MTHEDSLYKAVTISDMVHFEFRIFPFINFSSLLTTLEANKIIRNILTVNKQ